MPMVVVVGSDRERVHGVGIELAARSGFEIVEGVGRKDQRALEVLRDLRSNQVLSVVIVCDKWDEEEQIIWQCWTHRFKGVAVTWSFYERR